MGAGAWPRASSPSMQPCRKLCRTRVRPSIGSPIVLTMARLRPWSKSRTRLTAVSGRHRGDGIACIPVLLRCRRPRIRLFPGQSRGAGRRPLAHSSIRWQLCRNDGHPTTVGVRKHDLAASHTARPGGFVAVGTPGASPSNGGQVLVSAKSMELVVMCGLHLVFGRPLRLRGARAPFRWGLGSFRHPK